MIRLSILKEDVFDPKDTGMSYYNDFLNPKEIEYYKKNKNRIGKIVMMSPREYYEECAKKIFNKPVDNLLKSRKSSANLEKYKQAMLDGETFPMCMINYADAGQEGLHRMQAAGEAFGWDKKYPVLAIYVYDEDKEKKYKFAETLFDYFNYFFKEDVNTVMDKLQQMQELEPPINVLEYCEEFMKEVTKGNIGVDVQIVEDRGSYMLQFTPVSYDGIDVEGYITADNYKEKRFLEDVYELPEDFDPDIYF